MGDSRHRCALLLSRGIHAFAPWSAIRGSAGISLYLIEPSKHPDVCERHSRTNYVYLTPNLDAAIWEAEITVGEGPGKVYIVEPIGQIEDASELTDQKSPPHPSMSWRSREPLRVIGEVTEWPLYHGTRVGLKPGDLIKPGHTPNFGNKARTTTYVYLSRTLDAATWGTRRRSAR